MFLHYFLWLREIETTASRWTLEGEWKAKKHAKDDGGGWME